LMADSTHDVSLIPLFVDCITHGFSINGQALVLFTIKQVPTLESFIEFCGVDSNQNITDSRLTGWYIASIFISATETLKGFLSKTIYPIGNRQITAHSAQCCGGSNGQNSGKPMTSPLGSARVGNLNKKVGQRFHVFRTEHDLLTSCKIWFFENRSG